MFKNKYKIETREIEPCIEKILSEIKKLRGKEIDHWKRKYSESNDNDFLKNKIETIDSEFNSRILEIKKIQEMKINGEKAAVKKYTEIFDDYLLVKNKCLDILGEIIKLRKDCTKSLEKIKRDWEFGTYYSDRWDFFITFYLFPFFLLSFLPSVLLPGIYNERRLRKAKRTLKKQYKQLNKILFSFNKFFIESSKENKLGEDNDFFIYCHQCGERLYADN